MGTYGPDVARLTPTQQLAGILLGKPANLWLAERRAETGRSWRLLARDLYEITNHQIDITHETARAWAQAPATEQAA